MMLKFFNEYLDQIEDNRQLQLDGELCMMLGKTPSQISKLEEDGLLSYDEKMFLFAFIQWRTEFQLENHVSLF
jgi:hypothetical protein